MSTTPNIDPDVFTNFCKVLYLNKKNIREFKDKDTEYRDAQLIENFRKVGKYNKLFHNKSARQ